MMRLVILNGWAASSIMLDSFIASLPASYDVHVVDDIYQFELPDIITKIDDLITDDTILLGWSLGGMLATYYVSLSKGQQPSALILLNSPVCFLERKDFVHGVSYADFNALKQVVDAKDAKAFVRLFSHLLVDGSLCYKQEKRLLRSVFNEETLAGWPSLLRGLKYLETFDFRSEHKAMLLPTLCIVGARDALINASSVDLLAKQNEFYTVKTLAGMGHYPFGVFVEEVTSIVVEYLSSLHKKKPR